MELEWGLRTIPAVPDEQGSIHSINTVALEPPVTPTSVALADHWKHYINVVHKRDLGKISRHIQFF